MEKSPAIHAKGMGKTRARHVPEKEKFSARLAGEHTLFRARHGDATMGRYFAHTVAVQGKSTRTPTFTLKTARIARDLGNSNAQIAMGVAPCGVISAAMEKFHAAHAAEGEA